MKILMVTHYFGSHKGGIEIVAEELFRQFSRRGHEIVWAAGNASPPPEAIGTSRTLNLSISNVVEKRIGLPFPIPRFKALTDLKKAMNHAQIVFVHDCLYLTNIAAFVLALRQDIPVVLIQHTIPNETGLANFIMKLATRLVTRPMLEKADQVVFISDTTRRFYGDLQFKTAPVLIFNGVDGSVIRPMREGETKTGIRQKLGLPVDGSAVLFVGRFVEKKGLHVLKKMADLGKNHTWAFAGWGPIDPNSWQVPNVRVYSNLRGYSLAELYLASDVLVLPSTKEGFPLVIQEALASGLPVVCGQETAASDSSMTSLVKGVPIHSHQEARTARAFLSAIDTVIESERISPEATKRRREFALDRYSWSRAVDRYLEIAERLCSRKTSASRPSTADAEKVLQ